MYFLKRNSFLAILFLFSFLYLLIAVPNHFFFKTNALDLGFYTNALYKYSHFQLADCNVFKSNYQYALADHFDLYLMVFSPLIFILGSYTLIIIQVIFILLGGFGVNKYFSLDYKMDSKKKWIKSASINYPLIGMLYFYLFFGVFSAISSEYHSNVVAASLVPWFLYFFKTKNLKMTLMMFLLILIGKENMSLWLAFICIGMIISYRKEIASVKLLSILTIIALVYFTIIIAYIMPSLSSVNSYEGFRYTQLGSNPLLALKQLIYHPIQSVCLLFINKTNETENDFIKAESHLFLMISGLYILALKPQFLVMLIPIYFQKMFHDNPSMWSISGQYSIEFAPILAIGIFESLKEIKHYTTKRILALIVIVGAVSVTLRSMDKTVFYTRKSNLRFYQVGHYENEFDTKKVRCQLSKIPVEEAVSAQSTFLPHLAMRNEIYQFPIIKNANFIVFSKIESSYPLEKTKFTSLTDSLLNCKNWSKVFISEDITVLKKLDQF